MICGSHKTNKKMELSEEKQVELWGNWAPLMSEIGKSKEFDDLYRMLKSSSQQGKVVVPRAADVWKSWKLCDRHKVKAVIVGQDPYPGFKGDKQIANGVPFDCSNTGQLQPSLWAIWEHLEKQYKGFDPDMWYRVDTSYWLTEEHVLVINSSLTCEKDKAGSHWQYWYPVMRKFMEVLNQNYRALPICLLGQQAQKLEADINPLIHRIYKCEHPVSASYQNRPWKTECFKFIDEVIRQNNGDIEVPKWIRTKNETKDPVPF